MLATSSHPATVYNERTAEHEGHNKLSAQSHSSRAKEQPHGRRWGSGGGPVAHRLHPLPPEIGQVPLLTSQEEGALARRIQAGDDAAREQMIKANLRLVVKIARDYERCGVPLLDLINEGNIGLMKAVERFDPNRGAKLSTYAAWWIKQSIRRALSDQARTVRLPVHVGEKLLRIQRACAKLEEELAGEVVPTNKETLTNHP